MFKTVHNSPASAGKLKHMLNSGIIQKETNKQDTLNEDLNHIVKEKIQKSGLHQPYLFGILRRGTILVRDGKNDNNKDMHEANQKKVVRGDTEDKVGSESSNRRFASNMNLARSIETSMDGGLKSSLLRGNLINANTQKIDIAAKKRAQI